MYQGDMLIGGRLVGASDGARLAALNPATEEPIGTFPHASAEDVDAAVRAAADAWVSWFRLGLDVRYEAVIALADRIVERADEIATIEILDSGNTAAKVRSDVTKSARALRAFAELAYESKGESLPGVSERLSLTLREPYGVVARIIPFNHPIMFAASKLGAPLMAGNAVILKAPEQASLSICLLAELCEGLFPPGVVSILTGPGVPVGDALVRHRDVRRVAFTGSVETGLAIMRASGETSVKSLSLELGGKNPLLVLPDADLERTARAAVRGMNFGWQGQSCGSTSRILVHDDLLPEFLDRVGALVDELRVADPQTPEADMGPLVSEAQLGRVRQFVEGAPQQGATLVAGGSRPAGEEFENGYWIRPTVFSNVEPGSRLFTREVFGPVMAVTGWSDVDDAIALANSVDVALTASVWTHDLPLALRLAREIRAGYVAVNDVGNRPRGMPFGGFDDSGVGREEGLTELQSYSAPKVVQLGA